MSHSYSPKPLIRIAWHNATQNTNRTDILFPATSSCSPYTCIPPSSCPSYIVISLLLSRNCFPRRIRPNLCLSSNTISHDCHVAFPKPPGSTRDWPHRCPPPFCDRAVPPKPSACSQLTPCFRPQRHPRRPEGPAQSPFVSPTSSILLAQAHSIVATLSSSRKHPT